MALKGMPVQAFTAVSGPTISSPIFMDDWNALLVDCYVLSGTTPQFWLTVEGSSIPSAGYLGPDVDMFVPVADPNGRRVWVRSNQSFTVMVGAKYARMRVNAVSGSNLSLSVIVTPFVHPGGFPTIPIRLWSANLDNALANVGYMAIWTPTSGLRFRVLGGILSGSVAGRVLLRDGTSLTIAQFHIAADTPAHFDFSPNGYLSATIDQALNIQNATGSTAAFSCSAWGMEEV